MQQNNFIEKLNFNNGLKFQVEVKNKSPTYSFTTVLVILL